MRKRKLFILFLLPPLFLTGCWDKKDPEDRTFVISLGVDGSREGYQFTFAPADIESGEAEVYTAEAATLAGAVAQVDAKTSRKTDLGQLKTILFGQDILEQKDGLDAFLRELERSHTVSEKVMLLATEDSAEDCVKAVMKEDGKTGLFLWDFYKNTAREVAVTKGMDLDTFLTERAERGGNAVLPKISVKEEKLELGGGIAISSDQTYSLSDTEERGYLFLLGEAEGALLEEVYQGEMIPLEIGKCDVEYEFSAQEKGLLCRVILRLEGALQGGEGLLLSAEKQKELEGIFAEGIKEEVAHTLKIAERAGTDLFGVLPRMKQQSPNLTKDVSDDALWKALTFDIQPELEIKDMGRKR